MTKSTVGFNKNTKDTQKNSMMKTQTLPKINQ